MLGLEALTLDYLLLVVETWSPAVRSSSPRGIFGSSRKNAVTRYIYLLLKSYPS